MVMGDTVLLEDEVNLAMFVALESGLSVYRFAQSFLFRPSQTVLYAHRR
jgi:hypothetical protein